MRSKPYVPLAPAVLLAMFVLQAMVQDVLGATLCTAGNPDTVSVAETTPTSAFTDNHDQTITHNLTGLMWKQCSQGQSGAGCTTGSAQAMNWAAALASAAADTAGTHTDWRLPNKTELMSLVESCGYSPAINRTLFPNTPASNFWSGSSLARFPTFAWYVEFDAGHTSSTDKTANGYVRLVRGGQSLDTFDGGQWIPTAFSFTPQTGVARSAVATSNTVAVAGMTSSAAPLSVAGGSYAKGNGAYTTAPGTVSNGDTVTLQQIASATANATTTATLTIGMRSAGFNVTTVPKVSTTTTLVSSANPSSYGQSVTFTATVTGAGATGTVNFKDGSNSMPGCGAVNLDGGQAQCPTSSLSVASHGITAVYSGDGGYVGSTSGTLSQLVSTPAVAVAVGSSGTPSTFGQSVTLTATLTGQGPTGFVSFRDGAAIISGCDFVTVNGSSQAQCVTSSLSVGNHSITAVYSGDANNGLSSSPVFNQAVNPVSVFLLTVTRAGPGMGVVASAPAGINCGANCSASFSGGATVTLSATPSAGSLFLGWAGGGCAGTGACGVNLTGATVVSATFGIFQDVDGNGHVDALTDGLMLIRYMFGLRGAALTDGVIGIGATRTSAEIETYIRSIMP